MRNHSMETQLAKTNSSASRKVCGHALKSAGEEKTLFRFAESELRDQYAHGGFSPHHDTNRNRV